MDRTASFSMDPEMRSESAVEASPRLEEVSWPAKVLNPSSVVLIGASADPQKLGGAILANLRTSKTRLYLVNPKLSQIDDDPCYPTVLDVPDAVDLAVVAVPAGAVLEVVEQCVTKGIEAIVVISGGLGETGQAGKETERRLREILRGTRTRMLGPNTVGVFSPTSDLDATFMLKERWHRPSPGPVAVVSQSGALGLDVAELCAASGVGISAFISLGNKCDLNERDLVEAFARDPNTKCIAMYLEDFIDGRAFFDACRRISPEKPIVVTKAGSSEQGARAAASHTGALAGSDRVVNGVFKQAGVIRTHGVDDLVDDALTLTCGSPLYKPRLAVLTSAGGYSVTICDYLAAPDLGVDATLAVLDDKTVARLREVAVPFAAVHNPIDLTGSATNAHFDGALRALEEDPNVDAIIISLIPYPPLLDEGVVEVIERWRRNGPKPLLAVATGQAFGPEVLRRLWQAGVPAYPSPWQVARAVGVLCQRGEFLRRLATNG